MRALHVGAEVRFDAAIQWPGTANRLVEYRPLLRDGAGELCRTIPRRFRVFCVTRDTEFIAPPALSRKVTTTNCVGAARNT